jgi:prevent-host-death family protein
MDVAVSELRANLSDYLDRVEAGEEIVVTDRGKPVARMVGIGLTPALERLRGEGLIGSAQSGSRRKLHDGVRASGPVAEYVSTQRR